MLPDTPINYAESIDDLMAALTDDEERMMRMRLEGYDAQEIADEFKMERNAVYVRINRIIAKLRKRYGTGL
jgi:RNA polymerase sigma factor (sigma-70 family)